MKYSDKDIIKAIRTGEDRKALEALYKELFPKIKKIITDRDKAEEAKDIFQEALLIFYKQVVSGKYDEQYEVAGFIYTVAKNLWINRVQKKKRQISLSPETLSDQGEKGEESILKNIMQEDKKELIRKLLSGIGEKCRELLTYTIYQELKMEEVAEKMGFNNAGAATTAVFRCRQKLSEMIRKNKLDDFLRE